MGWVFPGVPAGMLTLSWSSSGSVVGFGIVLAMRGKRAAVRIPSGNIPVCLFPSASREKSTTTDDIKTVQTSLFSLVKDFFCRSFSGEEMQSLLNYVAAAQDEQQVRRLAAPIPPRRPKKGPQTRGAGLVLGKMGRSH